MSVTHRYYYWEEWYDILPPAVTEDEDWNEAWFWLAMPHGGFDENGACRGLDAFIDYTR